MADGTGISWADATWNVVLGCDRVSPGCDSCYAISNARIRESNPNPKVSGPYAGLVAERDGRIDWTGRVTFLEDRLDLPLRWTRPRRIFVNAQSDLFHDGVSDEQLARVFAVMAATPRHVFQILTKRHGRMRSLLNNRLWWQYEFAAACRAFGVDYYATSEWAGDVAALPNVWLGVSVEDQSRADLRIPALLDTPAAVRWISAEPLLGAVDLAPYLDFRRGTMTRTLSWVVVGGESGPTARAMHPAWARQLRDQCAVAGVPFHFKQWGEWTPTRPAGLGKQRMVAMLPDGSPYDGRTPESWHASTSLYRIGRRAAGRELDGRLWDDYPQPTEV